MRERLARIDELFALALERPPSDREAFLSETCRDDTELRREVEELLRSHERACDYFDDLGGRVAESATREIESVVVEMQIGSYRTLHVIGQGGMGTVYLAERADGQFDQRVALKVVRTGLESEDLTKRFLAERQILAQLQHPNIASLLDGGVTEDGRPYFVMEYAAGVPLTEYCDEKRLTVDERLRLFRVVAEAVQYAHRNLVVHRDLKPGNILITSDGAVKLLDFGIAKVLGGSEQDGGARATRPDLRPMTLAYAAPEQIRGGPVTTATDVYALGVILYELLSGAHPYAVDGRTTGELERAVLEQDPERPSVTVARQGETAPAIALARSTTPNRLRRRLSGDLDNLCLMALKKEPERRYQSAEQLSEDIRRHLEGLPVIARRDTSWYRAGKFIARHRVGVGAAAAIILLIIAFSVAVTLQSVRVARERDKAERVAELFVDLFKVSDPAEARGKPISARELLDRGADKIEKELGGQPEVQATLMDVLGRVYMNLGIYDRATVLLEKSLQLRRELLGRKHRHVADSLEAVAELHRLKGQYDRADGLLREALSLHRELAGESDPQVAQVLNSLGKVLFGKGAYGEAETILRQALEINREALGEEHAEVATTLNNLAAVLYAKGDDAGAEPAFRQSLAIRRKVLGETHPLVAATMTNLASLLSRKGDYDAAEQVNRESLDLYRKVVGPAHPSIATNLNNLALVLYAKGDLAAAEPLFRESLEMRRKLLGQHHPDIAQSLGNLGLLLQTAGRYEEVEPLYREALEIRRQAFGSAHPIVAQSLNNMGLLHLARGRPDAAEPLFREALEMLRKTLSPKHALVATSLHNLASALHAGKQYEPAEALYREALAIRREALPSGHPDLAFSLVGLGKMLIERGDVAQAEPLLREGLELRRKALPKNSPLIAEAEQALRACADLMATPKAE